MTVARTSDEIPVIAEIAPIPDEVIRAAITIKRWADDYRAKGMREIRVIGIYCDTYLSVRDMLDSAKGNEVFARVK